MPTLEKKMIAGHAYYYAVWKRRIGGKVRKVKQVYLGPVDKMAQRAMGGGLAPALSEVEITLASREFGGAALMLHLDELSGFSKICDKYLAAARADSSPGSYLFMVVANRLLHPTSKNGIGEWYGKDSAFQWLDASATSYDNRKLSLTGQNIWNYMDMLTDDAMEGIWKEVTERIREKLSISDTTFFFDTTNFFDYIDDETNEEKENKLPRKGRNKQHRYDKNQVSLSLFMGGESMMPYSHKTYAGNINDVTHFKDAAKDFAKLMEKFGRENVTLIIDKGCASKDNIALVKQYFFISTLRRDEKAAQAVLDDGLQECYVDAKGRTVYSSARVMEVKGVMAKVVSSFNASLERKESRTFKKEMEKAESEFRSNEHHAFSNAKAAYRFAESALPKNFRSAIEYEVVERLVADGDNHDDEDIPPECELRWRRNEEAIKRIRAGFGKNIIFTTRLDWSDEQIIRAYRSLYKVESQFKLLHGSMLVPITPIRHWTDQKIDAHIFLCMIGLLFARAIEYVVKKRQSVGGEEGNHLPSSFNGVIENAERIGLVMVLQEARKRGGKQARPIKYMLSNANEEPSKTVMEAFDLRRFIPRN